MIIKQMVIHCQCSKMKHKFSQPICEETLDILGEFINTWRISGGEGWGQNYQRQKLRPVCRGWIFIKSHNLHCVNTCLIFC